MFELISSKIEGCFEIRPKVHNDSRGKFVKTFHYDWFAREGLNTKWYEDYYSVSKRDVIRGLHFQVPPHDHEKLVYCVSGNVFDVLVDIRNGSPTYGMAINFHLSSDAGNMVYVPRGLAHGFCSLTNDSVVAYKVSTVHSPMHDRGVLWSSVNVDWPVSFPVISERDSKFPRLVDLISEFDFYRNNG